MNPSSNLITNYFLFHKILVPITFKMKGEVFIGVLWFAKALAGRCKLLIDSCLFPSKYHFHLDVMFLVESERKFIFPYSTLSQDVSL